MSGASCSRVSTGVSSPVLTGVQYRRFSQGKGPGVLNFVISSVVADILVAIVVPLYPSAVIRSRAKERVAAICTSCLLVPLPALHLHNLFHFSDVIHTFAACVIGLVSWLLPSFQFCY